MNPFARYLEGISLSTDSEPLDIIRAENAYHVYQGTKPLLTPEGNEYSSGLERVVQMIVTDLMCRGSQTAPGITAPALSAYQKDVFEARGDPFPGMWAMLLQNDPFVTLKSTGRFTFRAFSPEDELFSFAFITYGALISSLNEFVSASMGEIILDESETPPFQELLKVRYDQLSTEKKVALQALNCIHDSCIVLPLLLIGGFISAVEYAKGIIALKIREKEQWISILTDVTCAMDYLECHEQRSETGRHLGRVIGDGENDTAEFKSTLRWDIRAGKTNPAIERSSLKTIAAFLNSSGGNLLIGVRDDGSIEGIESDKFVNDDKFLLHLWTLIRNCLGRDVSPYISTILEKTDDKTVCLVACRQINRPVFLRQPGFEEAFYIRVGPSSNALDISEALKYIGDRFK